MPKRIRLSDFRKEREEQGGVEIEADDGQVFCIPPPELWPDEMQTAVGVVEMSKVILGAERYAEFVAAGGNAATLNAIFAAANEDSGLGESPAS